MVGHVPAWKKLGLHLKPATQSDDVAAAAANDGNGLPPKSEIKPGTDSGLTEAAADRRRSSERPKKKAISSSEEGREVTGTESERQTSEKSLIGNGGVGHENDLTEKKKSKKGRKSVSFAIEHSPLPSSTTPIATTIATHDDLDNAKARKQRKSLLKKQRRDSSDPAFVLTVARASTGEKGQAPQKAQGYLDYLSRYHGDRSNWKFNKTHQTQLLRDIFNIYRIPPSFDDAIVSYVAGLQGEAARARLRETCLNELGDEHRSMANDKESLQRLQSIIQREYENSQKDKDWARQRDSSIVDNHIRRSVIQAELETDEQRYKMQRRKRAAEILAKLAEVDTSLPNPKVPATTKRSIAEVDDSESRGPRAKRSRGRKRRLTGIPDDDSSSSSDSESDSDVDTDSSSGSSASTSSSSSSSSSSDSPSSSSGASSDSDSE